MTFHLPGHISFGVIGDRAVILDVAADRYLLLSRADTAGLQALADGSAHDLVPLAADRLIARGLVARGEGRQIIAVDAPDPLSSALEMSGERIRIGAIEAGHRRLAAGAWLRYAGLAATAKRWRRIQSDCLAAAGGEVTMARSVSDLAGGLARGFAEARLLIPSRRKCIPDSFALAICLWRRRVPADIYFGVRLAPFAAHCWVQAGDLLLSDPLDIVREFTPVFRL